MTEPGPSKTRVLQACLASVLLVGCATVQMGWRRAVAQGTTKAYLDFNNKYPKSPYADSALLRADSIEFERGIAKGDMEYYNAFANMLVGSVASYSWARSLSENLFFLFSELSWGIPGTQ